MKITSCVNEGWCHYITSPSCKGCQGGLLWCIITLFVNQVDNTGVLTYWAIPSVQCADKELGGSMEFCRLRPKGPIARVGFLRRRQLAPSPPVRWLGSAVSFSTGVRAEPRLLNDFSVLGGLQAAYSATLFGVSSCRSPSIWQQGGLCQPPWGPEIKSAGGSVIDCSSGSSTPEPLVILHPGHAYWLHSWVKPLWLKYSCVFLSGHVADFWLGFGRAIEQSARIRLRWWPEKARHWLPACLCHRKYAAV